MRMLQIPLNKGSSANGVHSQALPSRPESRQGGAMRQAAKTLEQMGAFTSGAGAFALSALVGVLDHFGVRFPDWAWASYGIAMAVLLMVCAYCSAHLLWDAFRPVKADRRPLVLGEI
jgi:hypothetical protein